MAALHEEDPTFVYRVDSELHQTIISAQGELHLEVIVDRLRRRFNAHVELGEPAFPYRETIKAPADSKYRHKKQTGGAGQFAEVWMKIEPLPRDSGVEFTESLSGQNVDRVFVPSVEEGVQNACAEGILAGYKVVDVKIDFYDGKMHPGRFQGHRLSNRRIFCLQGIVPESAPLPAGTDPPDRSPHSGRLPGQSDGRHLQPARAHFGHRSRGPISSHPRRSSRPRALQLFQHPPLPDRRPQPPHSSGSIITRKCRANWNKTSSRKPKTQSRSPNKMMLPAAPGPV